MIATRRKPVVVDASRYRVRFVFDRETELKQPGTRCNAGREIVQCEHRHLSIRRRVDFRDTGLVQRADDELRAVAARLFVETG